MKKKQIYLEKIRNIVDFYKPKIEEKTGVNLGDVQVKDAKKCLEDLAKDEGKFLRITTKMLSLFLYMIDKSLLHNIMMVYEHNIYLPFDEKNTYHLDFCAELHVIHELSHVLWNCKKKRDAGTNQELVWSEGFADYCERDYFSDLCLPREKFLCTIRENLCYEIEGIENGYEKTKRLIERYGEKILLDIPQKWEEFDKELSS